MKKKLPWLKYDIVKAEYMVLREQENDAKKKLDEAAKTLNNLKEPIEYVTFTELILLFVYAQVRNIFMFVDLPKGIICTKL